MERSVVFKEDIVKKVAKNTGYPEDVVWQVFYMQLRYIKYLSKRQNVTTIMIPKLGKLYFNVNRWYNLHYRKLKLEMSGKTLSSSDLKLYEDYKSRVDRINDYESVARKNNDLSSGKRLTHRIKTKLNSKSNTGGKTIEQIEEIQNKFANGEEI